MGCVAVLVGVGVAMGISFGGWGVFGIGVFLGILTVLNILFAWSPGEMESNPRGSYVLSMWWTAALLGTIAALIAWLAS